jgi:hypothetical protein
MSPRAEDADAGARGYTQRVSIRKKKREGEEERGEGEDRYIEWEVCDENARSYEALVEAALPLQ